MDLFGEFSLFLKLGKRDNCELNDKNIDGVCHYFQTVFVLWDGAFSFARKINSTEDDAQMYGQYVYAAVTGHVNLGLTITPKVHLMLKHVWWQMENIRGRLGLKMEDLVEKQHQMGNQEQVSFLYDEELTTSRQRKGSGYPSQLGSGGYQLDAASRRGIKA
jgi:hypothetical protein